jgi:hypothetical protein
MVRRLERTRDKKYINLVGKPKENRLFRKTNVKVNIILKFVIPEDGYEDVGWIKL